MIVELVCTHSTQIAEYVYSRDERDRRNNLHGVRRQSPAVRRPQHRQRSRLCARDAEHTTSIGTRCSRKEHGERADEHVGRRCSRRDRRLGFGRRRQHKRRLVTRRRFYGRRRLIVVVVAPNAHTPHKARSRRAHRWNYGARRLQGAQFCRQRVSRSHGCERFFFWP